MAQHDLDIANAPGAAVRADINNVILALVTNSSGAQEPPVHYPSMLWFDTGNHQLKIRKEDDSGWTVIGTIDPTTQSFSGAGNAKVTVKTSSFTVAPNDNRTTFLVDPAAAPVAVQLLAAATAGNGFEFAVKRASASANAITLVRAGSDSIDSLAQIAVGTVGQHVMLRSDGASKWLLTEGGGSFDTLTSGVGVSRIALVGGPMAPSKGVALQYDNLDSLDPQGVLRVARINPSTGAAEQTLLDILAGGAAVRVLSPIQRPHVGGTILQSTNTGLSGAGRNYWFYHDNGNFYLLRDPNGSGSWDGNYPFYIDHATGRMNFTQMPRVNGVDLWGGAGSVFSGGYAGYVRFPNGFQIVWTFAYPGQYAPAYHIPSGSSLVMWYVPLVWPAAFTTVCLGAVSTGGTPALPVDSNTSLWTYLVQNNNSSNSLSYYTFHHSNTGAKLGGIPTGTGLDITPTTVVAWGY